MYFLNFPHDKVIFVLYVKDVVITTVSEIKVNEFKKKKMMIFEMTELGLLYSYMGFELYQCKS